MARVQDGLASDKVINCLWFGYCRRAWAFCSQHGGLQRRSVSLREPAGPNLLYLK